jgi:hypothetical protein
MTMSSRLKVLSADGGASLLDVKYSVGGRRLLLLKQGDGDVPNGNASQGLAIQSSVMSVTMQDEVGSMPVNDLGKPRSS